MEPKEVELYKLGKKVSFDFLSVCLVIKCFVCGAHCFMFGVQCFVFGAQCFMLGAWCFVLGAQYSRLSAWYFVLGA